jgi:O-antigen/teichoic acid export membrane protein
MLDAGRTSLKQRVFRAGLWSFTSFTLNMALRFGSSMLMTRLLQPEMFGVMGMAATLMFGLAMFSDVGLRQSVVQSPRGTEPSYLNTAWSVQIVRGFLLWFLALCSSIGIFLANKAGYVSSESVYAAESLPYVIALLSISSVIDGFVSSKLFEASRGLTLGPLTRMEIIAQIVGLICMVVWTVFDRSIWALVAGNISSSLAKTILSHTIVPGVSNRWEWERRAVRELVHFGKWIFVSSIFSFLVNSGDRLLLGGLVNSTVLGLYVIASLLATSVEGILSRIMSDVSFPALSEVARERRSDLRQVYYRFFLVISSIAYIASGFFMTFGQSLISLLYDKRYEQAGWMLELLSTILLTMPARLSTQSFLALGMPGLQTTTTFIRLILLFVGTPIGFRLFGLPGAISAIVISHFASLPIIIFYNVRHQLFDLRKEIAALGFVLVGLGLGNLVSLGIVFLSK